MRTPTPFYLTYPQMISSMAAGEQRLWDLYPLAARRIQPLVEEAMDRIDSRDAFIYDEYPDRERMKAMCQEIEVQVNQYDETREPCITDLIETLFCHEMERRRQLF